MSSMLLKEKNLSRTDNLEQAQSSMSQRNSVDDEEELIQQQETDQKLPDLDQLTQSAQVKENNRVLRKRYRKLLTDLEESHNDLEKNTTESLIDHLSRANQLYSQVNSTFEATLDSRLLVMAADMGVKRARKMRGKTKDFSLELFKSCLYHKLGLANDVDDEDIGSDQEQEANWSELNNIAAQQIQPVPGVKFLLGPLSIQHKARVVKGTRNTLNTSGQPTTVPKVINNNDVNETENDTTSNVVIVANTLAKHGPINLFKFVINPLSYGQTIENIFFLSFLIRDGRAKIEVDSDSHPILSSSQPPTPEDYRKGLIKRQWIFEMDEMTWKGMIKLFNLKRPIIPHRAYDIAQDGSNSSWD